MGCLFTLLIVSFNVQVFWNSPVYLFFSFFACAFGIISNFVWGFQCLHIFANTSYCLFDDSHPNGYEVVFYVWFAFHCWLTMLVVMWFFFGYLYFLWRNVCLSSFPILKLLRCQSSLSILDTGPLLDTWFANISSHSVSFYFRWCLLKHRSF